MENSNNHKDLIIAFLGGAITGGVLAYLVNTDQGKEFVEEIKEVSKEKIKDTKEKISETEDELKAKLKAAIEHLENNKNLDDVKEIIKNL